MHVILLAPILEDVRQVARLGVLGLKNSEDVLLAEEQVPAEAVEVLNRVLSKHLVDDAVPDLVALLHLIQHRSDVF